MHDRFRLPLEREGAGWRDDVRAFDRLEADDEERTLASLPEEPSVPLAGSGFVYRGGFNHFGVEKRSAFWGHAQSAESVAFSPDGVTVVSASKDNTVKHWNLQSGELLRSVTVSGEVHDVTFSLDGRRLAAATYGNIDGYLWDALTGQQLWYLSEGGNIDCVSFRRDGLRLATGEYPRSHQAAECPEWCGATGLNGHEDAVKKCVLAS